jgi:hypothetical protein
MAHLVVTKNQFELCLSVYWKIIFATVSQELMLLYGKVGWNPELTRI